jgi:hypothetical protein
MKCLVLLGVLGACDPVWHIGNIAKPAVPATDACIDSALHETTYSINPMGENAPKRGWYVNSPGRQLRATWDPAQPQSLTLVMMGVGTAPPPNTLQAYRQMRDVVLEKLNAKCGTFDAGPEHCMRMTCDSGAPPQPERTSD